MKPPDVQDSLDSIEAATYDVQGVYVAPRTYVVSILPPDWDEQDPSDYRFHWEITVEYAGQDRWAVRRSTRCCLSRSGEWTFEPRPSERDDKWLEQHRFSFAEALEVAAGIAPMIGVNGVTAREVLKRHQKKMKGKAEKG